MQQKKVVRDRSVDVITRDCITPFRSDVIGHVGRVGEVFAINADSVAQMTEMGDLLVPNWHQKWKSFLLTDFTRWSQGDLASSRRNENVAIETARNCSVLTF